MIVKNNYGFTLIEMIVAVAIVGIMATAAIMALNPLAQFQKADNARRKSDLAQIQRALESYYQDAQRYPKDSSMGTTGGLVMNGINDTSCPNGATTPCPVNWGKGWQPYMNVVPQDPTSKHYVYYAPVSLNGQGYCLYASLDKETSSDACKANVGTPCGTAACGGTCNFGVCSPNLTP